MIKKEEALEAIHAVGGCGAMDEWAKGCEVGVNAAYKAVEQLTEYADDTNIDITNIDAIRSEIEKLTAEKDYAYKVLTMVKLTLNVLCENIDKTISTEDK